MSIRSRRTSIGRRSTLRTSTRSSSAIWQRSRRVRRRAPTWPRSSRTISGPGGTEYTWEELPEAIEALQNGEDIDYTGASGAIDMDEAGDATAGVYDIYEFTDGAPEPIDEVEVATPE